MFTSVRGFWGAVGVAFALVALYLVLNNSSGATRLIGASADGGTSILRVLQGR